MRLDYASCRLQKHSATNEAMNRNKKKNFFLPRETCDNKWWVLTKLLMITINRIAESTIFIFKNFESSLNTRDYRTNRRINTL